VPPEIPIHRSNLLEETGLVLHGISGKHPELPDTSDQDNMSIKFGDAMLALKNKDALCDNLGIVANHSIFPEQVHGTNVNIVNTPSDSPIEGHDGLVTAYSDIPLAIKVADCVPIFMLDTRTPAIGLVHAGWRGTVGGIAQNALEKMKDAFSTVPSDCLVWLGPSIGKCCFEVGPEVTQEFRDKLPSLGIEFGDHIDLIEVNRQLLIQCGVPERNMDSYAGCTCCEPGFYSYRRATRSGLADTGRMMAVMQIRA